jgi:outer membrane lipoprotein carrier protein
MLKRFFAVSLIFFVSLCLGSALAAASDDLEKQLAAFQTYQADFTQSTFQENGRIIQAGRGAVKIKRPGKFAWMTKEPTEQHFITNGKILWIYDKELEQATEQALSSRTAIDPAALLSGGVANLNQYFIINTSKKSATTFILTPKAGNVGFKSMELFFSNQRLVSMKVVNELGQISEFHFDHIILNAPLADKLFNFIPPKGVDVVKQ